MTRYPGWRRRGAAWSAKIAAALTGLGDAGAEARSVVDSLRKSLQATAAQAGKSARSLAKFDEINRLAAPESEKASSSRSSGSKSGGSKGGSGKTGTDAAAEAAGQPVNLWQGVLQSLRDLWARFWAYLQSYYAPAIAAWQAAWGQMSAVAAAIWEPLRNAALSLWNGTLVPLAQYLATVFLPGVVNSFSEAFGPIVCGAISTAITLLGEAFQGMAALVNQASATIIQPALAVLLTVWQGLMTGIQNAWTAYGQPLLDGVAEAFRNLAGIFQTLWATVIQPLLAGLVATLGVLWTDTLDPLWQQLTLAQGAVGNLVLTLWNTILAPLINWLVSVLGPIFTQVFSAVVTAVTTAMNMAGGAITGLLAILRGLADFISNVLQGRWSDAWNAMATTVITVWIPSPPPSPTPWTVCSPYAAPDLGHAGLRRWGQRCGARRGQHGVGGALRRRTVDHRPQRRTPAGLRPGGAVPALPASGAVIPPNRAFLALLATSAAAPTWRRPWPPSSRRWQR